MLRSRTSSISGSGFKACSFDVSFAPLVLRCQTTSLSILKEWEDSFNQTRNRKQLELLKKMVLEYAYKIGLIVNIDWIITEIYLFHITKFVKET